jgi:valyl-tRNA synthetase
MITRLAAVVDDATASFEAYDYARALQRTEEFFWWFCDFYLELVKGRRYGSTAPANGRGAESASADGAGSVSRALRLSLSTFQRLFAPFLPFVSEEVWSWWNSGSIHLASWPDAAELRAELDGADAREDDEALAVSADVLREVRKAKTQAQRPMRAPVLRVRVSDTAARLRALELGLDDLVQAGSIERIERAESDEFAVAVELA